eukprot:2709185-Pleurochrysis_carterae.AAC.3
MFETREVSTVWPAVSSGTAVTSALLMDRPHDDTALPRCGRIAYAEGQAAAEREPQQHHRRAADGIIRIDATPLHSRVRTALGRVLRALHARGEGVGQLDRRRRLVAGAWPRVHARAHAAARLRPAHRVGVAARGALAAPAKRLRSAAQTRGGERSEIRARARKEARTAMHRRLNSQSAARTHVHPTFARPSLGCSTQWKAKERI